LSHKVFGIVFYSICIIFLFSCKKEEVTYQDVAFFSEAFQTDRNYRIYLPENYNNRSDERFPVIYYFHGYGGRYKWDSYDVEDDVHNSRNRRKEPPFVMEWQRYVKENDLIIVSWDGYEPNLHPGKKEREGIQYGNASPYDYVRAHDEEDHHWGLDFSMHFRDLVAHVDQNFRTHADRKQRGITGLSMGGLTSYYVAGQNKDLVSSVSAFDPADNFPLYGPKGEQVVFPILEMFRPLKGLAVRLTMTDGDWLKYNNWRIKQIFESADLTHFESHTADYPDHWAADIDLQLDFHMKEFQNPRPFPEKWNHVNPGFSSFDVLGFQIEVQRKVPALTIMKGVSSEGMKIFSRPFLPEGPMVQDEMIQISTPSVYSPNESYHLIHYNLSENAFTSSMEQATNEGNLHIKLGGGGYLLGINGKDVERGPKVHLLFDGNSENVYFEEGMTHALDFKLLNVGSENANKIEIKAFSEHPYLNIAKNSFVAENIGSGEEMEFEKQFEFEFINYSDSSFVGSILFEIKVNDMVYDTTHIAAFPVPISPYVEQSDRIILDGRTVGDVPFYSQGLNEIELNTLVGGNGNGDGVLDPGEQALVYIRLPKGLAPNDTNTFHRTYLINHSEETYLKVEDLDYTKKISQAGATSVASLITLSPDIPKNREIKLWLKVESLYNDSNDSTSNATIYSSRFDYVKTKLIRNARVSEGLTHD